MRIGQLAARTGVSVRALRYYEEQGLLTSERSPSGQRHYAETAVERVLWIQCLYAAGLSSKTIREFLPCTSTGVATPADIARLAAERDRIDAQMANLATTRDRLDAVIAAAGGTVRGEVCRIPQSA
ncbi:MerR family transcriptional regulator [Streptomyces violaceusniger]|uniref:MerR family transcriptional regulator n=1 Tax=Streptomyces violaceusniger TaxID=68280 RepID=A0A4D4L799_STRVO|nr:MerR family transcriptional regulator [Streptomyces violaceusniger]